MSASLEIVAAQALKLAPADRSHLLERLMLSLDFDAELEAAWELEADRREASLAAGPQYRLRRRCNALSQGLLCDLYASP